MLTTGRAVAFVPRLVRLDPLGLQDVACRAAPVEGAARDACASDHTAHQVRRGAVRASIPLHRAEWEVARLELVHELCGDAVNAQQRISEPCWRRRSESEGEEAARETAIGWCAVAACSRGAHLLAALHVRCGHAVQLAGVRPDEVVGRAASRRGEAAHDGGHVHVLVRARAFVAHEHGARRHAVHGGLLSSAEARALSAQGKSVVYTA